MFHRQGRWEPRDLNELRKVVPGDLTPDLCFLITTSWLKSKQTKYRERRDLCLTENSFKVMILCFLRLSEWWCQRERNRREDKGYGFNFYTECIVQNAGLDESQDGIKIGRRNINSIRYANDRYHSNGRKQGGTKKPLEEGEGGEWKSCFKIQHSKKQRWWHSVPSLHDK